MTLPSGSRNIAMRMSRIDLDRGRGGAEGGDGLVEVDDLEGDVADS
jgi:hypothetical protein